MSNLRLQRATIPTWMIDWHEWREDQPPCEDHIAIARALIDAGLEVDPWFSPACKIGHRGMVAALIDTGKVSADVMNAAVGHIGLVNFEDFAMIRLLVERGANINVATDLSKEVVNPLTNAIMHCDANMVRLLVELGADVNVKDSGEHNPFVPGHVSGRPTHARGG